MVELNDFVFRAVATMRSHASDVGAAQLDFLSREILYRIAEAHLADEPIIVGDIISNDIFGSPATAHGRLKKLVKNEWIQLIDDKSDGRRKLLRLTDKSIRMYNKISMSLVRMGQKARA